jgi:hypothetical protein
MSALPRTALLIGAGFSVEMGMPLVWELSDDLRKWLTPQKLRAFNIRWRSKGGGHPDEVIEQFVHVLIDRSRHYEQVLGWLQIKSLTDDLPYAKDFHGLYIWLVQMISAMLYLRHRDKLGETKDAIHLYDGLREAAAASSPLWIFSLNHDLYVEILADELGLRLGDGFPSSNGASFPLRDSEGRALGRANFKLLSRNQLSDGPVDWLLKGEAGINLVKLHGGLDIFCFTDELHLVKLSPRDRSLGGWVNALCEINENLLTVDGERVPSMNEIGVDDDQGKLQFLRRTLLAGSRKFEARFGQNAPPELLRFFESHLATNVDVLVAIGISMGDEHINAIVKSWLDSDKARQLHLVGPGWLDAPSWAPKAQVVLKPVTATRYLANPSP